MAAKSFLTLEEKTESLWKETQDADLYCSEGEQSIQTCMLTLLRDNMGYSLFFLATPLPPLDFL